MLLTDALTSGALWWVAESLRGSVLIIDAEEVITYANRGAYDVCKLDPAEKSLIGMPLEQAFSYTGFRRDISPVLRCLRTGEASYSNRVSTNLGEFVVDAAPIFSGGRLIGAVALTYNITDHARVEQELLEVAGRLLDSQREVLHNRHTLDWFIESSPMSIAIVDKDYNLTAANKVFMGLAGITELADVVGQPYDKALSLLHNGSSHSVIYKALQGTPQNERHTVGDRIFDVSAFSIMNPQNGEVVGAVAMGNDVTENVRLNEEIMRLDRLNLVGELAAGIAHEIRNPMTTVRGFLQLLQRKHDLASYRPHINLMIEELDRANSIISNYLSLSKEAVAASPCNLSALVAEFAPLLNAEAVMHQMRIEYSLRAEGEINADASEMKQLLANLAKNAFESMQVDGVLTISTYDGDDGVILEVSDTGSGIAADVLSKLGTPFVTTKVEGTGLGLAVCYRIAERHAARIAVDSSLEGTTFTVLFPSLDSLTADS